MDPCRGRGRLLGSQGPLYFMRAPVPEDKRSTFTSRGYMTGYTINPCIGSTSTSLAGHVPMPACLGTTRETCPTGRTTAREILTLDIRTSYWEGGEHISHTEDVRSIYAYHSGSHASKKLVQSLPWEVPLRSVWSRTTNPFLTANRTQAAGNGAREVQAIHQVQCFLAWPGFPTPLPFHGAQIP